MKLSVPTSTLSLLILSSHGASAFAPSTQHLSNVNRVSSNGSPFSASFSSLSAATLNEVPTTTATSTTIVTSDTEEIVTKSFKDDGFVFGLEGSGLTRPKGKVSQIVVEGDSLQTTPYQQAIVTATFVNHAAFSLASINQLLTLNNGDIAVTALQSIVCILSSYILADFGSGVLHWSVDNYGNGRTPIMGNIIAAFQGHHTAQWTITERGFCNNVHKLCTPFGIPTLGVVALLAGSTNPLVTLFFAVFCSLEIMSQEFHKWSHMTRKEVPPMVNTLQKNGLILDRVAHANHHIAPFEGNYCIVSGICNKFLDNVGFFRRLEHLVWKINSVESNAWKLDPELRSRTLRGEYEIVAKGIRR